MGTNPQSLNSGKIPVIQQNFRIPSHPISLIVAIGAAPLTNAAFGPGTGAIVLDNTNCRGNETSLTSCPYSTPNGNTHSQDAGVRCNPGTYTCM